MTVHVEFHIEMTHQNRNLECRKKTMALGCWSLSRLHLDWIVRYPLAVGHKSLFQPSLFWISPTDERWQGTPQL